MARAGQAIANPGTGERIVFGATRADTGGERLEFELTLAPLGRVGGVPHKHEASERFTIRSGRLSLWFGPVRRELGPGESVEVPPGATHYVFNDGDEEVRASVVVRPARNFETFFETVFAIAARRRFKAFRGLPPPLHGALLADTYGVYGPALPIAVQRPLVRPLAALARRRGYPAALPGAAPAALGDGAR
jgi:mannose-6-phosphate isomerase-like protein (cupin superfamily)